MDVVRSLCQWFGIPKELISRVLDRKFPRIRDAVAEGNIKRVEEYKQLNYPIAGDNQNILHIALQNKQFEMAQYIIDNFENIRLEDKNMDGDTPLMLATLNNNIEIVKKLIFLDAPLNSRQNEGATPVIAAAASGSLEILKYLISHGANPYIRNFQGQTALHRACFYGKINVVSYLINKQGPNLKLSKRDRTGNNCLHLAAQGLSINCLRYFTKMLGEESLFEQKNDTNESVYDILQRQLNIIRDQDLKPVTRQQVKNYLKDRIYHLNVTTKKNCSKIPSLRSITNILQ